MVAKRIKERRQALNMSVDELGEIIGKDRATIYRYESDDIKNLPSEILESLSRALHTTPSYIMGWDIETNTSASKDNKKIFSENLNHYINLSGKSRKEICDALDIKYSTFTDWVLGRKYPRIDKIEAIANYFGVSKSDLIEESSSNSNIETPALLEQFDIIQKAKEDVLNIILRLHTDKGFLEVVELLQSLDKEKFDSISQMIKTFAK